MIDKKKLEELSVAKTKLQNQLDQQERDYLYSLGVKHMQANDFAKAVPIFQLLTACNTTNELYLKALAGCLQATGDYINALFSYKYVYALNIKENSDCLFYCGVCLYKLENYNRAKIEFTDFINAGKSSIEMLDRAKLYLEAIERELLASAKEGGKEETET